MSEYSYVEVLFDLTDIKRDVVDGVIGLARKMNAYELTDFAGPTEVVVEQARYGFDSDEDVQELVKFLMANEIAFEATDGGSYEWGPEQYAWRPGFENIKSRPVDVHGGPLLDRWAFDRLISRPDVLDPDIGSILVRHFRDDPADWL